MTGGLRSELRAVMQHGARANLSNADFNNLALRAFRHQFALNQPYRRYCERRACTPATIDHWTQIVAVPTAAFKEVALVAGDADAARLVFKTSGTTRGSERRGSHYILDPSLYEASLLPSFRAFVLRGVPAMRMMSLIPDSRDQPDSSLSHMVSVVVNTLGTEGSGFFATVQGLLIEELRAALADAIDKQEPVCLLGTALAFVHLLSDGEWRTHLPEGSRLMDTGGFKGERIVVAPHELRTTYMRAFGIPPELCINEYGMTELCSQYYDDHITRAESIKQGPPWLRARVVDPETLQPLRGGETGILQHFDLANLDSVSSVLTEDLAFETDDGFVLLGRAPGAPPRGCSIAMDILLSEQA